MTIKFFDCHAKERECEFYKLLNQVEEKLKKLLNGEALERIATISTLEEEVNVSCFSKKVKLEYSRILHNIEPYSTKIFRCEVLLRELRKY